MKWNVSIFNLRLFTNARKEPYLLFDKMLGFKPKNIELYQTALIHRSSSIRQERKIPINNERLEFLGDAVLSAIVSDILYHRYPNVREGFLTNTRSKIVSRSSLNRLAIELGLDKLLKVSKATSSAILNQNLYGNTFEALIGAIYLDQGYERCKQFVAERILKKLVNLEKVVNKDENYKSLLLEWAQARRITFEFRLTDVRRLLNNEQVFHSSVYVEDEEVGAGTGRSKKESEQHAAKEAYNRLRKN